MIISGSDNYLTIGSRSYRKGRIKVITTDGNDVIIDATGRNTPMDAPGNIQVIDYREVTDPVFESASACAEHIRQGALLNQNYNPETDETVVFQSSARTDIAIADVKGGDPATIQLPYLWRDAGSGLVGRISDAGALDINGNAFVMCGWINDIELTSGNRYFFGKYNTTATNGCYTLYRRTTTGFIAARAASTETSVLITSTVIANQTGWHFIMLEIDAAKVHLYIDNVEVGTGTAYTGTFPNVDELYKFNIGCANANSGGATDGFAGHVSDLRVYHKTLTPTEKTTLFNRGDVSGATLHIPCSEAKLHDISGNNLHPAIVGITVDNIKYGDHGSRQGLDIGYDIYKSPRLPDIHIPLKSDGTSISITTLAATYYKHSTVLGNALHNGFDSNILYSHANFDRSDDTIYSDFARAANTKYIAATPKAWHINEHAILTLKLFANTGYKARTFPKWVNGVLTEVITSNADKATTELRKALQYSNNYEAWHEIEYYVDDRNIVGTRLNFMLVHDLANSLIKFSIDGGLTYVNQAELVVDTGVCFVYIYENGNYIVGTDTKLFYSHDLGATLTESTVLDENGDPFVAPSDGAFSVIAPDNYFKINGIEMPVWGNRSAASNYKRNINAWYTIDGGVTVKSFLHFDGDGTDASVAHIHAITHAPDDSFWIQTGDGGSSTATCRWYEAIYNVVADTWATTLIQSSDLLGYFKTVGFGFADEYVYWSSDSAKTGIWKSVYADIADATKFEKVAEVDLNGTVDPLYSDGLLLDGDNMIVSVIEHPVIMISSDGGKSWFTHTITGLPDLISDALTARLCIVYPANNAGYHLIHMVEVGESQSNGTLYNGKVLMLKITKP